MIQFTDTGHSYESIVPDGIEWISVTRLLEHFKEPFNKEDKAAKCSIRKPGRWPNKWHNVPVEEIIAAWDNENKRATDLGHWYHKVKQYEQVGGDIAVYHCMETPDGVKIAPPQKLSEGIYPEHIVYLQTVGICGQVDRPEVNSGILNVNDYKTNKEIKRVGFTNWEGITKKLLKPLHHLDDCELNLYSLQLSLYAYMILRHNPMLTLGKLTIEHVKFKETGRDKYDYPLLLIENGEPVIDTIEYIECEYMSKEVNTLINWLKEPKNRKLITKH